jgi:crossover junction endodeoxyribonuclease RuvC
MDAGFESERILLGIDPGLRVTGYGIVRAAPNSLACLAHGAIRTPPGEHSGRLLQIHGQIRGLLDLWHVDEAAIEKQFVALNVSSAFAVGEARAAALLACAMAGVPVSEYTPAEVKQAVTSYGRSGKSQIQEMVRLHFGWTEPPQPADAADALAIAICHAARRSQLEATAARAGRERSRALKVPQAG